MARGKRYLVILKSTVTPDVYGRVCSILTQETLESRADYELISNPEFLAEGTALRDFAQPHRVIIGVNSTEAKEFMEGLYSPFTKRKAGLMQVTDPRSAIVSKLAANSFLACRVALINELARYCDVVGADIESVRTGLASDPRIGQLFLYAGPGVWRKLLWERYSSAARKRTPARYGCQSHTGNRGVEQPAQNSLAPKDRSSPGLSGRENHRSLGLAFKARTDDLRESPSLEAIEYLLQRGARIHAHDPQASRRAQEHFGDRIKHCDDKYAAVCGADALVIMTEWDTYKSPDFYELRERLAARVIFDGRNIFDPEEVRRAGLTYVGMEELSASAA